jgi:hypothetical protein
MFMFSSMEFFTILFHTVVGGNTLTDLGYRAEP